MPDEEANLADMQKELLGLENTVSEIEREIGQKKTHEEGKSLRNRQEVMLRYMEKLRKRIKRFISKDIVERLKLARRRIKQAPSS